MDREKKALYKKVERQLYRENRLFLLVQLIGGFFPGLAILGIFEGFRRFDWVKENIFWVIVLTAVVIGGIWIWKSNYRTRHITDAIKNATDRSP